MIKIFKESKRLIFEYTQEFGASPQWVEGKLDENGEVPFVRTFTFLPEHLITNTDSSLDVFDDDYGIRKFVLGTLGKDGYYKIDKKILGLQYDLLLHKDLKISHKTFTATEKISIFRRIDELVSEQIIIGGIRKNAIPTEEFERLLKVFPTTTTVRLFASSRISKILKDYLGTLTDAEKKLEKHLSHRKPIKTSSKVSALRKYEIVKYEYIRDRLKEMLAESDSYDENEWQKLMLEFLLLLFPKYVAVLEKLRVKDYYTNPDKTTDREIDLTLVDANGNIDIIEIKKPFDDCLLSIAQYRNNYTPKKELSGSVMQVEKYLFHLNKYGAEGEKQINAKRSNELPNRMKVRITNPKAMIILGRDHNFASNQKFDFEIIKRKYANVIDIMTYDDLLRRLENIIQRFKI